MGFDDWGAFSVLNAAGCTPQKALGVEGMMPSNFAGNFSKLLQSWFGDLTTVYQGPPDGTCYGDKTNCYPWFSWLFPSTTDGVYDEGYRSRIFGQLPQATKFPWVEVNDWPDEVSNDADEFWACEPGEEYTLLVISPQSAVASRLLDPRKGAATRKCIKEIVFMGGMFGNVQLKSADPGTSYSMEGPLTNVSDSSDPSKHTEVNVVSDVNAANAMWVKNLASFKGVPMRILSLETASCARVGLQKIQFSGQTGMYTSDEQLEKEDETIEKVRATLDCQNPPNMLTKMVCMHKGCDIATLDFDVVAGTYVWLGDADKTVHFQFKQILPSVDPTTAVTTSKYDNSTDVWIATTFDAPAWLEVLVGKLNGK